MLTNPAQLILVVIASIAATVWLISLRYLVNSPIIAARRPFDELDPNPVTPVEEPTVTRIVGAVEVEGEHRDISRRIANVLARDGILPAVPVQILERTDERITFRSGVDVSKPRGELRLSPLGSTKTRVDYVVDYTGAQVFLRFAWVIQALGLIVLALGYWVVSTFVVNSANMGIRSQSFQIFQVIHFIWPPFMLGYRYRNAYQAIRTKLDTMLSNLPHTPA